MISEFAGSISEIVAVGEIKLVTSVGTYAMQFLIRIDKSLIETAGSGSALPTVGTYTRDEINALFVKWIGNEAGKAITFLSPNSAHERITGVRDDGSAQDDVT